MSTKWPGPLAVVVVLTSVVLGLTWTAGAETTHATPITHVNVIVGNPSEFKFTLAPTKVPAGTVAFTVRNKGALAHRFKICSSPTDGTADSCAGKSTVPILPGKS